MMRVLLQGYGTLCRLLVIIWTKAATAFFKAFVQMHLVCIHPPGQDKRYPRLGAL